MLLRTYHSELLRRVVFQQRKSWFSAAAEATQNKVEEPLTAAKEPKIKKLRHTKNPLTKGTLGPVNIHQAIDLVKEHAWAKFDETVNISVNTGMDPRKPNQSVKGVAKLPSGTGKASRVCVIAKDADAVAAKEAGADVVGAEDVIAAIQGGDINFTSIIATPSMMPLISKIGRILGPRGLMPNPKMGTVTLEVTKAVKAAKAGAVQFKTGKRGTIQAGVGKVSFTKEALLENIRSFFNALQEAKPEAYKGTYMTSIYFQSTMGPSIHVDLAFANPLNPRFMLDMPVTITADSKSKSKKK